MLSYEGKDLLKKLRGEDVIDSSRFFSIFFVIQKPMGWIYLTKKNLYIFRKAGSYNMQNKGVLINRSKIKHAVYENKYLSIFLNKDGIMDYCEFLNTCCRLKAKVDIPEFQKTNSIFFMIPDQDKGLRFEKELSDTQDEISNEKINLRRGIEKNFTNWVNLNNFTLNEAEMDVLYFLFKQVGNSASIETIEKGVAASSRGSLKNTLHKLMKKNAILTDRKGSYRLKSAPID